MNRLRRPLIGLAVLAFALGIVGVLLALTSDHDSDRGFNAALVLLIGWGFAGTGLYAWDRRPGNNIGPLMTAIGFSGFLKAAAFSGDSALFTLGSLGGSLFYGLLIHLLLSFPSGRLQTRFERLLVGLAYFDTTVVQFAWVVLTDPVKDGCANCPSNPLLVDNATLAGVVDAGQVLIAVAALAALVAILYRRWRASSAAERRAFAPLLGTGALTLTLLLLALSVDQADIAPGLEDVLNYSVLFGIACVPFAFLLGLLRSRFSRGEAISSLMARLGDAEGPGALREVLAASLGDSQLELAYWIPDRAGWVDADGQPISIDTPSGGRVASVVERDGAPVAAILHDPALDDGGDLVQAVGAAAALALENERLDAELRAHVEELRASRARIVEAGYAERRRVERNIHDGAQQRLMALGINLQLARSKLQSDPAAAQELLDSSLQELSIATGELRELARGIHPAVLTDRGLEAAIAGLAGRSPVPVQVTETPDERLPAPVESAAYFVVAEALTNVARYADAGQATVTIRRQNGRIDVEVSDDGIGGADPSAGSGLSGLADRVQALGGKLVVNSPAGRGTKVMARIPCAL